jgi:hypothetical protein
VRKALPSIVVARRDSEGAGVPEYADLVGTTALLLGAVSVGWQVARTLRERDDIVVVGREVARFEVRPHFAWMDGHPGIKESEVVTTHAYSITVRNVGPLPVTVTQVGWQVFDPAALVDMAMHYRVDEEGPWSSGGPVVPHRIESHDEAAWIVSEEFMRRFYASARARALVRLAASPARSRLRPWRRDVGSNGSLVSDWIELERVGRLTH